MPKLKDIMTSQVDVISPHAMVTDAALKMRDLDVGAIPVCEGDRLLGIVTDRDLVLRVMALSRNPFETPVHEAMTAGAMYCYEDEEAEAGAALMADKQIRRLPIFSRNQQLVGIVSLGDLAVGGVDLQTSGVTLHRVSDPSALH